MQDNDNIYSSDAEREYQEHLRKEIEDWEGALQKEQFDSEKHTDQSKNLETQGLSEEDIRFLVFRKCRTKRELRNWIKTFLRVDLPDTCVDPDSTSNPMDMCWKLYETAVWYDELTDAERHLKTLFYCSRGSFKTLAACVVELLIMIHAKRDAVHIGLIESQAKTAYNKYFRPFLELPYLKEYVRKSTTLNRSELVNEFVPLNEAGQVPDHRTLTKESITTLEVIPLTMNKTSSPRAHLICKDEIDKTKGEQVAAYENAYGMLTMTNDRKMAMEFDISSRDSAFGKVQDLIDNAPRIGCKVYHWNRLDITERCPDERSGTKPVRIFTKENTLTAISEEEFKTTIPKEEHKHWKMEWGLEGCLVNCKMFGACRGYLKNQTSKCKWLKPVEETQKSLLSAPSEEMAIAQLLCRLPPKKGLVYSDFDPKKNILDTREMYKKWKGIYPIQKDFGVEDLIRAFKGHGVPCYLGYDAGFHHPACVLLFVTPEEDVFIVKEHMPDDVDSAEMSQWLKDYWFKYMPERAFVDVESPDAVRSVRKQGFTVAEHLIKARQPGIATVKWFLKPPAMNQTKLFLHKDCMGIKYEFLRWSYKIGTDGRPTDEAEKSNDHAMDAIRYILHNLFGKSRGLLSQGEPAKAVEYTPEYLEAQKKLMIKNALSPQAVAGHMGYTVIDNRNRSDYNESYVDKEGVTKRRSLSKYDIGET